MDAVDSNDYRERGHAASGGMRRQLADDFVVLAGRRAWNPADLESSAIGALHHVETVVEIEDRKPGRKRLEEGLVVRGMPCCPT